MLRRLCAETRSLRESILRRVTAVGCRIDDALLPEAEAIVDSKISKFLFAPEYTGARRALAEGPAGDSRAMTLLVLECTAKIDAERRVQRTTAEAA
jgi:hypothetical protein